MIIHNSNEFAYWLCQQPHAESLTRKLTRDDLATLHDLMHAITDEVSNEQSQMERESTDLLSRDHAAAHAARERTAKQNVADAVAAEIDGMRHG